MLGTAFWPAAKHFRQFGLRFSSMAATNHLHIETPLLYSVPLSKHLGADVYLKLDCLQPSGSFKIRGIGNTVKVAVTNGAERIVSSSGGNAGLAAAYAAMRLDVKCTVVLPTTTPPDVHTRLKEYGAEVVVHGSVWDEADARACEIVGKSKNCGYVHPFSQETTQTGHATLVEEISRQLPNAPDAIVTCCGGGGLLMGIIEGVEVAGWTQTRIIVSETEGASCLAQSLAAKEVVALTGINSIAKSLGALKVDKTIFDRCVQVGPERLRSFVTSDAKAVAACMRLSNEHRLLVEPACGACLAAVIEKSEALAGCRTVVVEVCGGAITSIGKISAWARELGVEIV